MSALTDRFSKSTLICLGIALLPFFVFNWYFYFEVLLLSKIGLLGFAGNLVMLGQCAYGARVSPQ